jgi:hypothetical protein
LNNLVEVWLDYNECVHEDFRGSHNPSLTTMDDTLKNCFDNCLDDDCAANMIENNENNRIFILDNFRHFSDLFKTYNQ